MPESREPLVLELSCEIDVNRSDEVVARGMLLLDEAPRNTRLVVDLGGVEFIDSSGLSGLLRLRRLSLERGRTISLREVPPDVASLLRLAGIDQVLPAE